MKLLLRKKTYKSKFFCIYLLLFVLQFIHSYAYMHIIIIPYEKGRSYDVNFVDGKTITMINHDTKIKHFSYTLPVKCRNKRFHVQKIESNLFINLACPFKYALNEGSIAHENIESNNAEKNSNYVAWV